MKFIHTSDWHIGRLFQNISLLDDQLYVLQQLKHFALTHHVDALVVAGDIFDRSVPPADAVDALNRFLADFTATLKIPVIMISGNHDSAKRLRFGAQYMQGAGVYILSDIDAIDTPIEITSGDQTVRFYGIPYHDPVEVREAFDCDVRSYDEAHTYLVDKIKPQLAEGIASVLISHCFIDGAQESDSERPLSIGGADRVSYEPLSDFNYVALGHLHGPQYKGHEHIRYSGSLMKYSFSEYKQSKGVTLVDIAPTGETSFEHLPLTPKRELRVLEGLLEDIISAARTDPRADDYLLIKLTDSKDILDPMGQLRAVYLNVLQLERLSFAVSSGNRLVTTAGNQKTELEVFEDFFEQVMGDDLSAAQTELLTTTIAEAKQVLVGTE
ncbi:exonuclease SbcCD subunit D [Amphritea sp. 1_MG-2023]|uniref:exonuclease SbcCD subunit D n=1 Tax=Amphritea sp. 1_MG-2023 TaxID=3062670 RepID=UPI0026E2CF7F|nr:exonuclease SbcCD subunit D [Amphritea sp. 1_MG-2023]MDO6564548.1 exonuclease SbcCD subunit D [Amphritea sp. 1_MG-2023]